MQQLKHISNQLSSNFSTLKNPNHKLLQKLTKHKKQQKVFKSYQISSQRSKKPYLKIHHQPKTKNDILLKDVRAQTWRLTIPKTE
jgi:hypothetical protein